MKDQIIALRKLTGDRTKGTTVRIKPQQAREIDELVLKVGKQLLESGYEPLQFSELTTLLIQKGLQNFDIEKLIEEAGKK
ncbi:TPA: hypothetical protein MW242_002612 [Acinetobacter baumannii]|nr:hypothetical protein [Acinetobacter baumannii]